MSSSSSLEWYNRKKALGICTKCRSTDLATMTMCRKCADRLNLQRKKWKNIKRDKFWDSIK